MVSYSEASATSIASVSLPLSPSHDRRHNPKNKAFKQWRIVRRAVTVGHCPRSSRVSFTARDPSLKPLKYKAYCDMKKGGWQLIYNRRNIFFSPDHMKQKCPKSGEKGAELSKDSISWCIPDTGNRWRWEAALNNDPEKEPAESAYFSVTASIPDQARRADGGNAVSNQQVRVYENSAMGSNSQSMYYQRYTHRGGGAWGCSSGRAAWFGLVKSTQAAGDQYPNGIGGHCDGCSISGKGYTWGSKNIEYYHGRVKSAHGCNGAGGSACTLSKDICKYGWRYRFWTID